ncbi:MAG: hypothetical protein FWG25_07430, partial [Promicromonosporaceae bacterium]|nr:hypothetical protein [Promicromonosporaceae bacterium]
MSKVRRSLIAAITALTMIGVVAPTAQATEVLGVDLYEINQPSEVFELPAMELPDDVPISDDDDYLNLQLVGEYYRTSEYNSTLSAEQLLESNVTIIVDVSALENDPSFNETIEVRLSQSWPINWNESHH